MFPNYKKLMMMKMWGWCVTPAVDTIKCILSSGRAEKAFVQSGRDIHITVPPVGYVMGSID